MILEREDTFVRVTPALMQEIFPELKESEDERIRQNCIHISGNFISAINDIRNKRVKNHENNN